jgi:hypothetical protein
MSNKQSDNPTLISSEQANQPTTMSTEDSRAKMLQDHAERMSKVIIKVLSGGTEEEKKEGRRIRKLLGEEE